MTTIAAAKKIGFLWGVAPVPLGDSWCNFTPIVPLLALKLVFPFRVSPTAEDKYCLPGHIYRGPLLCLVGGMAKHCLPGTRKPWIFNSSSLPGELIPGVLHSNSFWN
ncbi:hypothetical protein CEXT_202071 [Caerostris extrusa]|uniref:Uncharacterized protein n=1 Tax=Caerostris extrusa TaxID=172846 RepID=A0AAV4T2V9_CAEEX|nr:hypothetical protein CEXT_202071 [Caerostris extrusa]